MHLSSVADACVTLQVLPQTCTRFSCVRLANPVPEMVIVTPPVMIVWSGSERLTSKGASNVGSLVELVLTAKPLLVCRRTVYMPAVSGPAVHASQELLLPAAVLVMHSLPVAPPIQMRLSATGIEKPTPHIESFHVLSMPSSSAVRHDGSSSGVASTWYSKAQLPKQGASMPRERRVTSVESTSCVLTLRFGK